MMKKLVAITLAAVLILTVLISGASGYSDCAARCMREMAKAHPHAAMGSTNLRMPDCCSGNMQSPCEMNAAPEVKIPECSVTAPPTGFTHLTVGGTVSCVADADPIQTLRMVLRASVGELYKYPPIYLQTLSLLC